MQYTESILEEQLKRGEKLPVGWPWRLLLFTVLVFSVLTTIYLGMVLGYKPYLNSRIKSLDKEINNLTQAIDDTQQKNLANFYSQLVNIQNLLAHHPNASKLFDFLEKNTHNQVYFLSLNLSLAEKNLKIEGSASDYEALAQQLEIFRKAPEIERVFLEDSKLSDDKGVHFIVRLIFNQSLVGL